MEWTWAETGTTAVMIAVALVAITACYLEERKTRRLVAAKRRELDSFRAIRDERLDKMRRGAYKAIEIEEDDK